MPYTRVRRYLFLNKANAKTSKFCILPLIFVEDFPVKRSVVGILGFLVLSSSVISGQAMAGSCEIQVTRKACKGKEAESYGKCGGKPVCEPATSKTSSADKCKEKAQADCSNSRLDITDSKVITAKYDGVAIDGGKNLCDANRPDFGKCP